MVRAFLTGGVSVSQTSEVHALFVVTTVDDGEIVGEAAAQNRDIIKSFVNEKNQYQGVVEENLGRPEKL